MMFLLKIVLIGFVIDVVVAQKSQRNYTFTYSIAAKCKEFDCKRGYFYDTFFDASQVRKSNDSDVAFEMHIAILAPSNGHIVLSPVSSPGSADPVYELVIGGGGNRFTELRRNLRRNAKVSNRSFLVLSSLEFRPFYIRITKEGEIQFGRPNDPLPLLSYFDMDPIPIRYFGFAAWNNVEAKFLFDCPFPSEINSESQNVVPVMRNISNTQKLKESLLTDRDPYLAPSNIMFVNVGYKLTYVYYDAFESILTTGLAIVVSWSDDSIAWNPDNSFNITSLQFREGQIWQPTFFILNSDSAQPLQSKWTSQPLLVNSTGETTFHFRTEAKTYCTGYEESYSKWPRDEYSCSLVIQPWENHETILLSKLDDNDEKMKYITDLGILARSEWKLKLAEVIVPASKWNEVMYNSYNDSNMHDSDRLIFHIKLKREASRYNIVFYTPLLVLTTFVLLSFWTEPLQMSRVWFYVGVTMVLCMGLCYIDVLIPCHTTPYILIFYNTVLSGVLVALLLQVSLMTKTVEKWCQSQAVQSLLMFTLLRTMCCLPALKTCNIYESVNEGCSFEDDDASIHISDMGNVEELQSDNVTKSDVHELAECLDKLMFVVYSVTVGVMLGMHF